jgi:glycosyltransferase involved in cell wall biosynthesis
MNNSKLLSIVLPCRNQGDHIHRVIEAYLEPLTNLDIPFELVVVPNASTDRTEDEVRAMAEKEPRIRVVANSQGGWGLSVRKGLEAARGELLGYTNTARTDPTSIPQFVERYRNSNAGLVKARRENRNAPMREIGSAIYNFEARLLLGIRVRDVNGTPKVFSRDFYQQIQLREDGDLLDLELMAYATELELPILEIPIQGFQRHGGKSSTTLASAWNMYRGAVRFWRNHKRVAP